MDLRSVDSLAEQKDVEDLTYAESALLGILKAYSGRSRFRAE